MVAVGVLQASWNFDMTEEQKVLEEIRATIRDMTVGEQRVIAGYADTIRHVSKNSLGAMALALVGAELAAL